MKKSLGLWLVCFVLGVNYTLAQTTVATPPCGTMIQDSINRLRFPRRQTIDQFENAIQQKINEFKKNGISGRTQGIVVTIPIIVHVVHNGEAVGSGLNISQGQIQSQIDVLNEDYRKKVGTPGFNTNPVGADIEIEFCLSPVDANGVAMAEPGIDRYNGHKTSWIRDDIEGTLKPTTIWNPNLFFNVWTLKFGGVDSNLLGYAQFPDNSGLAGLNDDGGPASTDGVVVQYSSFGSVDKGNFPLQAPYNKGRTLSHETGHWLGGLRHIWGDGNCADDFVGDTPTQQGPSNGTCPNVLACNSSTVSAMVQNYMDYSNDACMNVFTQGQKLRFMAVMQLSPRRGSLVDANLCSPVVTDVPTANFTADKTFVLLGGVINFTDLSTNFPTAWNWTFEGGDPATSTARNPRITYSVPGQYKVTLIATNSVGDSAPLELDDYITVSDQGLCGSANNFKDSYTPSFIPLSNYGPYTGYLTGTNSLGSQSFSEFFANSLGYEFISGAKIRFGHVHATSEDAAVKITVWNARGPQHAPGSIIETKTLLLKQIMDDVANNRATTIVFDRESPVQNLPFHVGVQLSSVDGDSTSIQSSADGEATDASSWIQDADGAWKPYTIAFGANIAMNIEAVIGMSPSVQVSASQPQVFPGQQVVLNGHGASIFVWTATNGSVPSTSGPQLVAYPTTTTTYMTVGSGLTLCNDTTYTTIYVRNEVTGVYGHPRTGITLYPNPGRDKLNVQIDIDNAGQTAVQLETIVGGIVVTPVTEQVIEDKIIKTVDTSTLPPGVYLVTVYAGKQTLVKKWVKY